MLCSYRVQIQKGLMELMNRRNAVYSLRVFLITQVKVSEGDDHRSSWNTQTHTINTFRRILWSHQVKHQHDCTYTRTHYLYVQCCCSHILLIRTEALIALLLQNLTMLIKTRSAWFNTWFHAACVVQLERLEDFPKPENVETHNTPMSPYDYY